MQIPQKVQPSVFDNRGVQLQREEFVVKHSDGAPRVDVQENQRPLHEAGSLYANGASLMCGG